MPSRASDQKDSTPRHGRLLHPSSWAERDDRDHAADNFFQGGSPKQATPLPAPVTSLTNRKSFYAKFPGMGSDENLKLKSPPTGVPPEARRQWVSSFKQAPLRCAAPCRSQARATWQPLTYPRLSQVAFVPSVRSRCLSSVGRVSRP